MRASVAALLAAASLFVPGVSRGEPTATVTWLMNEPMSLFDWGIYKADKKMAAARELGSRLFTASFMSGSADYDWDANRIRLRVLFSGKGTDAECLENLKLAKGVFLDFKWTKDEQVAAAESVFGHLFSHEGGYRSKATPAKLGRELANISAIEATVFVKDSQSTYAPRARCEADFRSEAIRVLR